LDLTGPRCTAYGWRTMNWKPFTLFVAALLLLAGCTGYQLGGTLPSAIQTVSLTVVNRTGEPSIEVGVMHALRAEIQQDGRLTIVEPGEADAVLSVTLRDYRLKAVAFDRVRGTLAREYRATINAAAVLYEEENNTVIAESSGLIGEAEFPFDSDLTTAKMGALPGAAADLARKIVSTTLTAW